MTVRDRFHRVLCRPGRVVAARLLVIVFLGILLAGWLPGGQDAATAASAPRPADSSQDGEGRIALKLAPGARLTQTADGGLTVTHDWGSLEAVSGVPGLHVHEVGRIEGLGVTLVQSDPAGPEWCSPDARIEETVRALRLLPGVLWAEAAQPVHACLTPDDPYYPVTTGSAGQWGVQRVGLPHAWDITTGSAEVVVAVIDTGVNPNIADFSGRLVSPYSVLEESGTWPAWRDDSSTGHGTAVSGIAVAQGNNGHGIAGAAWNVKLMPVKISADGDSDTVTLAAGIDYAVAHGADVINVSFATPPGSAAGQTLKDAVASAIAQGVVVVAAAGNWNAMSIGYPAALPGVIAVGATDSSDARWVRDEGGSNMGTELDLSAPGSRIVAYYKASTDSFTYYEGTSMAAPLVAGVAALMRSVDPLLSPGQIVGILNDTAEDLGQAGWDDGFGCGLLDAAEAVARAGDHDTTGSGTSRFTDVTGAGTPYWDEIEYVASQGIVTGYDEGLFYPYDPLKRQQFAKMIVLALNRPVSGKETCPFTDVLRIPGELYPYHYIAAAYQAGIVKGTTSKHFSPYRPVTRAELITMVVRALGLPDPPANYTPSFGNFSATHYPNARKAAYAGLLDGLVGMGPSYDFLDRATRGEVCALLYALLSQ